MSKRGRLSHAFTCRVRDTCLCLHVQRAARALARRFDEALRPLALTQGQFSLLMSLNRPQPPSISEVSALLAMDRTTVTANVKPDDRDLPEKIAKVATYTLLAALVIGAAVEVAVDFVPVLVALLAAAAPIWQRAHAATERRLRSSSPDILRASLHDLC